MAPGPSATIALIPLDERPVNTGLVADVAAVAGFRLALPPAELLPSFRSPGAIERIGDWLLEQAGRSEAVVVSIDTLVHGGLIPARTSEQGVEYAVAQLGVLRRLRQEHPGVRVSAVSLVTRASDSYSNVEEPLYWSEYGRNLHALGASTHHSWRNGTEAPEGDVPEGVRADFALRRLRNHVVTLSAIALKAEGVLDTLVITADDTAEFSAGSVEQEWVRYWGLLAPSLDVPLYPGADETGAVLVARTLCELSGVTPRVRVLTGDAAGWDRIPPYENEPLGITVPRQANAAGAVVVGDGDADLVLVVHPSDTARGDQFARDAPKADAEAVDATVAVVREAVAGGLPVVLADLRYANGADDLLMAELERRGLLPRLAAYGGWNTAGNALGSALALGVATVVGRSSRTFDPAAADRARARRFLDDWAYQAQLRRAMQSEYFADRIGPLPPEAVARAEEELLARLGAVAQRLGLPRVDEVSLPWKRSFEVDIRLEGDLG